MKKEKIFLRIAKLIPKKIRYWIVVVSIAKVTSGKYSKTIVPELTAMDVLKRLEEK